MNIKLRAKNSFLKKMFKDKQLCNNTNNRVVASVYSVYFAYLYNIDRAYIFRIVTK